ncbi:hypothetical protein AAW31_16120 [Nitrosomonas communis]|uniref:Uncharacterized protein n=1 Tax=Nitrosomonas communis TaxID=44574 RepID=A0A0F7KJM2_9PROT|nr:hypothetical protein AAW31_16120 [Nitrosomonas communis]
MSATQKATLGKIRLRGLTPKLILDVNSSINQTMPANRYISSPGGLIVLWLLAWNKMLAMP